MIRLSRIKNGKYIFEKEGVYFSLTIDQIIEFYQMLGNIMAHFDE